MAEMLYTAYRTVGVLREFRCGGCGFASRVEVTAKGAGQTTSQGVRRNEAAAHEAEKSAAAGAEKWAEIFLQLCPCPKCGWRDPVHAGRYKKRFFITGAVSLGILLVGGALIPLGVPFGGGVIAFFGLLGAVITPAMGFSTYHSAAKQVKFLHGEAAGAGAIAPPSTP